MSRQTFIPGACAGPTRLKCSPGGTSGGTTSKTMWLTEIGILALFAGIRLPVPPGISSH